MNRREYIKFLAGTAFLSGVSTVCSMAGIKPPSPNPDNPACDTVAPKPSVLDSPYSFLTPADEIKKQVDLLRPSKGGALPADLARRLGATHVDGKYHLTQEPFLLEGAKKILEFGSSVCKVWFDIPAVKYYPWNSDWSALPSNSTLVDMAKHPYYDALFNLPFSTFVLEITSPNGLPDVNSKGNPDFSGYTQQFQDLSNYLYGKDSSIN